MILAFFIGVISSVHCVGMCGPLMFALPAMNVSWAKQVGIHLLYQLGRILTYGLLGFVLGLLGAGTLIRGWQQYISLVTGIILLLFALYYFLQRYGKGSFSYGGTFWQPLFNKMGYWIQRPGGHFVVGLLNGLLPCGMVYLALAAALNTGSPVNGFIFMAFFGLGTVPLLLIALVCGHYFRKRIRLNFIGLIPFLFLIMGVWFILRGANLDIAYLSPLLYPKSGTMLCH
ncbi:sulfite exporter TauE/SafE family protein [Olivibacter sp. SA151]|uniref:sulfite exporter TauE/SafE family protein n=1 Tax=Olivibacter jilunii TaxID=985016 RepID=UPI003F140AD5